MDHGKTIFSLCGPNNREVKTSRRFLCISIIGVMRYFSNGRLNDKIVQVYDFRQRSLRNSFDVTYQQNMFKAL